MGSDPIADFDRESEKYIHRFLKMTDDTGLSYPAKAKMIYVQLDTPGVRPR